MPKFINLEYSMDTITVNLEKIIEKDILFIDIIDDNIKGDDNKNISNDFENTGYTEDYYWLRAKQIVTIFVDKAQFNMNDMGMYQ